MTWWSHGWKAVTDFAADVIIDDAFRFIQLASLCDLSAECQKLEGLLELAIQLYHYKDLNGVWPTSLDQQLASNLLVRLVDADLRPEVSYETSSGSAILSAGENVIRFEQ